MKYVQDKDVIKMKNVIVVKVNIVYGMIIQKKINVLIQHQLIVNHVQHVNNVHQQINIV